MLELKKNMGVKMLAAGNQFRPGWQQADLAWFARAAAEGRIDIGWTPRKLNLAAVGTFPHHDMIALAVRRDLGLRSLHEIDAPRHRVRGPGAG